ncbi:MAG: thermonuclease family protein [bacterium]|nr:thermonuclease family protein [bacterium]
MRAPHRNPISSLLSAGRLPLAALAAALALAFLALLSSANAENGHKRLRARIVRVLDGESFQMEGGLRSGLLGVAAPSRSARGGRESAVFLRRLLEGRSVELEVDERLVDESGMPRYYIFLADGTMVNELMIVSGYARAVVKHPNVRYRDRLIEAENTAKRFRRGVWGDEFLDPKRRDLEPPNRLLPAIPDPDSYGRPRR